MARFVFCLRSRRFPKGEDPQGNALHVSILIHCGLISGYTALRAAFVGELGRRMASKVLEQIYLHGFVEKQPQFQIVDESATRESPDFLLRDATGVIGVEVTQVFRNDSDAGSPAKAAESRRQAYLGRLAAEYYAVHGRPLYVEANLPNRPDTELSSVVEKLHAMRPSEPWDWSHFSIGHDSVFNLTALPDEAGSYKKWICINNSVGWVGRLHSDLLAARIEEKAPKLPLYRTAADRVALLLVVDRTNESGMLQWPDGATPPSSAGFDAIFLYLYPREVFQLA
jgi:hypothetical protein